MQTLHCISHLSHPNEKSVGLQNGIMPSLDLEEKMHINRLAHIRMITSLPLLKLLNSFNSLLLGLVIFFRFFFNVLHTHFLSVYFLSLAMFIYKVSF